MKLEKKFHCSSDSYANYYEIIFTIKNDKNNNISAFKIADDLYKEGTHLIDINNLNNKEFLEKHDIEFTIECDANNKRNIIPTGIIEFEDRNYPYTELRVCNFKKENISESNQILKNIERAIEIKYEAEVFLKRFKYGQETIEIIDLDRGSNILENLVLKD